MEEHCAMDVVYCGNKERSLKVHLSSAKKRSDNDYENNGKRHENWTRKRNENESCNDKSRRQQRLSKLKKLARLDCMLHKSCKVRYPCLLVVAMLG